MARIGIRRIDITPPVGIPLMGFAGRGVSTGIHDPLFATALVASESDETVVIIGCDLLGVNADLTREVREEVTARTGLPPDHLMIACTHTHYGPNVYRAGERPDEIAYQSNLKYRLAGVVEEAMDNQEEARLGVEYGASDIGINRRERGDDGTIRLGQNPDGPVDRSVGICRIDTVEGEPVAVIVNFATHPVSQTGKMRLISADYPGQVRNVVEQLTGATCLFLQGACGNINPIRMENDYEPARSLGTRLGCEAVRIWETTSTSDIGPVRGEASFESLPAYRYGSLERAEELVEELTAELERLKTEGAEGGAIYWTESRLGRVKAALSSWRDGVAAEPIGAEFQALRIGDLAVASASGEIFTELGSRVREDSKAKHTFFSGYANGSIGYVPVPEAYDEGGYEVTHACRVDPEASSMLLRACGRLIANVAGA